MILCKDFFQKRKQIRRLDYERHSVCNGQKRGEKAVIIDLKRYGELWEDFYDRIVAHLRSDEPRESLASVKKRLRKSGKLYK